MESKKGAKYLAFDSLKGLKESIVAVDEYTTKKKYPNLSMEERNEMDTLLLTCYLRRVEVIISYYDKGDIDHFIDIIQKIDLVRYTLKLMSGKTIHMSQIVKLEMVEM